ncbi:MAG: VWA domain-containing protein [Planctomycetaceae bacterium]|nr:VWA domain-containing protein [Planctomycetaceae bacterium]
MTFLGTAFLMALPLAAAPLLLHLFDRRRNVVIEWGAMQFLVEAASERTSARKLKQWLLLLLRVLAIAALVLGLAQTQLAGTWFGQRERGETIFVVDNSMSTQRMVEGQTLFDSAIERATQMLDDIPDGDAVRVLSASPYPVWTSGNSLRIDAGARSIIADLLAELRPTNGRSDLLSALFTAVQAEVEPTCHRRRIVLLTDGQRADWTPADESGWNRFGEVLQTAPLPTELLVVDTGTVQREIRNPAVNEIHSSRTVVGLNQPFSLTAQVQNHAPTSSPACGAAWLIGDEELYESQVPTLEAGAIHDVVWKHSFSRSGVYAVSCRIQADDELAADNMATVVIEVVEEVPVVVLENSPELAELQRDAFFVEAALGSEDGDGSAAGSVFVARQANADQLERLELDQFRAVVIPNLTVLNEDVVRKLQEFVFGGGGLWLAAGPRTDPEAFNQYLFADGEGLSPLALDRIVEDSVARTNSAGQVQHTTLDPAAAAAHPAMAELADTERLDTAEVKVEQRFRFVPPPDGEQVSVMLQLSNGEPLAAENYVGRGRVIVQSVPLRLEWSELARSQAFVVMVQDWLAYLTQPRATRHNLAPGDPITVLVADSETQNATLKTPHGDDIELTGEAAGDGFVFRTSRTILPGEYVLELGAAGDRIPFHVNRDPLESDLSALTDDEEQSLAGMSGPGRNAGGTSIAVSNLNDPIWGLLFVALIVLIAGELLLSGLISRERFGSDPIAETTEHAGSRLTGSESMSASGRDLGPAVMARENVLESSAMK